jgi:hypothetical protein
MSDFNQYLESLARQILELLPKNAQQTAPTAWELKLKLQVSLTQLYLALGMLIHEGCVTVVPEGLTYRIHLAAPAAQREGSAPLEQSLRANSEQGQGLRASSIPIGPTATQDQAPQQQPQEASNPGS